MRYFIFTILLAVPLLLTAQSKKEQIATLNLRVDSLSEVLVNVRLNNAQTLSDKSDKIFQLSQEKSDLEKSIVQISQEKSDLETEVSFTNSSLDTMQVQLQLAQDEIAKLLTDLSAALKPAGDETANLNPWEGVYLGDQGGYYLTKSSGEPMVINGKKIPVPGSDYTITMKGLGIEVVQIAKDRSDPILYIGNCLVDSQSDTMAQLSCTCKEQSSSTYPAEPELSLAFNLLDQTMVVNGNLGPEFTGIKQ